MTTHIMLDLKTWGKTPGCDIRSIGAVVFDPLTGAVSIPCRTCKGGTTRGNVNDSGDCSDCMNTRMERGYGDTFYIATDNPRGRWRNGEFVPELSMNENERLHPLFRDPETVKWWNEQSEEAQAAFANPVDLRDALFRFDVWLDEIKGQVRIKQPNIDPAERIRLWAHGPQFDVSILSAAYRAVDLPEPWHYRAPRDVRTILEAAGVDLKDFPHGTAHNALDDAVSQAMAVCEAYRRLGLATV